MYIYRLNSCQKFPALHSINSFLSLSQSTEEVPKTQDAILHDSVSKDLISNILPSLVYSG